MVVGGILCAAFPLAYLFLKLGGAPESVFWAANITMFISEFASVFILKKYIKYSISKYLLNVHARCLLVTAVSFIGPYFLFDKLMDEGFVRLIITTILTTISVGAVSITLGMNKEMRMKLILIIKTKITKR